MKMLILIEINKIKNANNNKTNMISNNKTTNKITVISMKMMINNCSNSNNRNIPIV